jgi:hypothetical protein
METDAEAGGSPPSIEEIEAERRALSAGNLAKRTNAAAPERTPDGSAGGAERHAFITALGLILVCGLLVVGAYFLWR